MTQADSVHSTPPTNTPTTRRRFLSNAAGVAVGGTALALATASPRPALAAPAGALDEAHERLKAAKARFDADDAKLLAWEDNNPEPRGKRAHKLWVRRWKENRGDTVRESWAAQLEAEKHFRTAQMAVAKIDARDMGELALKACLSGVYDKVRLAGGQSAVIGFSVALNLISLTMPVAS